LYGNDEADFTDHVQDEKDASSSAVVPPSEAPAGEATPTPKPAPAPSNPVSTEQAVQPHTVTVKVEPTSVPTFTPPVTQQIPTYEQPQTAEYREPPPSLHEGGYQSISVPERTIRPSEMKDEG
jgi:hypothetical protein